MKARLWIVILVALSLILSACATPTATATAVPTPVPPTPTVKPTVPTGPVIDCMGAQAGDTVNVMYVWSGAEEEKINAIFQPFIDACGVVIVAESTRDLAVVDTKVQSSPPDLLFWPSTAPVNLYSDKLKDLSTLGVNSNNYAGFWKDLGSKDGVWLALPIKADIKSIIWYSPVQFTALGYEVPTTFEELNTLVEKMVTDGYVPWSTGMESGAATGWTGSDFIQDILLAQQGPEYVMKLISGEVPYNDAGVVAAYETYKKWAADPLYDIGGADGTINTGFLDAIYKVFSDPPQALMVKQSGFAGGEIVKQYPSLVYGTDFDFFAFPGAKGMQGGADFLMAFSDAPAAKALLAYLTGPVGAENWAKTGFDLSPNKLAVGKYTDPQLAKKADALANAAGFTPDIGDTIPAPFGEAEWKAVVDVVQGVDIPTALLGAASAQAEATGIGSPIDCMGAQAGDTVNVMYVWSGAEEEKINAIFQPFIDACGVVIVAESTRDLAVVDTKVQSSPPDLLFWPSTAPVNLYSDKLKDLSTLGVNSNNYAGFWKDLGSKDGVWLALPIKADIKSIIWYSPVQFTALGYQVPTTFEELNTLVEKMVTDGYVPWSTGMESGAATGWTGSDFIQDILLAQQGPEYVMKLISGEVPYNDAGVVAAYETYKKWAADPLYDIGGADGTINTGFLDAIYKVFSDPPQALMVKQSGFAGGEVVKQYPSLVYGTDFDFFAFPGAKGMQGGADFLMAFSDAPAAKALLAYLAGPIGAKNWAKVGFDLSPNKLAVGKYTDPQLAKKADALANAAGFTPDIGDTIPAPFGEAEWKAVVDVVQGVDIPTALLGAASAQAEALKK